jgi:hypothetical protein
MASCWVFSHLPYHHMWSTSVDKDKDTWWEYKQARWSTNKVEDSGLLGCHAEQQGFHYRFWRNVPHSFSKRQGGLEEWQTQEIGGNIQFWWSGWLKWEKLGNPARVKCGKKLVWLWWPWEGLYLNVELGDTDLTNNHREAEGYTKN